MSRKKEMKQMQKAIILLQQTTESHNRTLANIVQVLQNLSGRLCALKHIASLNLN